MRRFVISTLLPILAMLALATPADAGWIWCKTDPVVRLNGTLVDILIAIPLDSVPAVNGPTQFEIQTPRGVERELILNDLGYNGHGSEVVFTDGPGVVLNQEFPTTIRVHVPIDETKLGPNETVPLEVTVTPINGEQLVVLGDAELTTVRTTILGQ
jgi:hypothetical protein